MRKWLALIIIFSLLIGPALALKKGVKKMNIISPAFKDQEKIPGKYSCQGAGVNPPLSFVNVPSNTKSLALLIEDPDAPSGTFDHWVIFNIPKGTKEIKEGIAPAGANLGSNSIGKNTYVSPCPPPGNPHHYIFTLYALNTVLPLKNGATKTEIKKAMNHHLLAEAKITGLYQR